jgi:hypothetical protein
LRLNLLYGRHGSYYTDHRHLNVIKYLSHTENLTYEEFLLVSLSLSIWIWGYSALLHNERQGLPPFCTTSNAQKPGACPSAMQYIQCCHNLYITELFFCAHIFKGGKKSTLTLNHLRRSAKSCFIRQYDDVKSVTSVKHNAFGYETF